MSDRFEGLDFSKVKTYPLERRPCKVHREDYAAAVKPGASFEDFLCGLPRQLKAVELKELVSIWVDCVRRGLPAIVMCGAHVLKVGLGPLLIQAMEQKWISALALNGAGAVHDFELAYQGATSEDVASGLEDGTFGMVEETGRYLNLAARRARESGEGYGQALAGEMERARLKYCAESVIVQGARQGVPVTIHVGIGTDIVHQHPGADGAAIGAASYRDFQRLAQVVAGLRGGGLVMNFGSAVILPEVFLKALTVARNLTSGIEGFSAANFDMLPQYRPAFNVVQRPTQGKAGGKGFQFTGHHELTMPLLFQAMAENWSQG